MRRLQSAGQSLLGPFLLLLLLLEYAIGLDQAGLLELSSGSLLAQSILLHGNLPHTRPAIGSRDH